MHFRNTLVAVLVVMLAPVGCNVYQSHGYGKAPKGSAAATPLYLPETAPSISQRFRTEFASSKYEHRGFDILVPSGTPVLAAADGRVSDVSTSVLYGRQVMLDHAATAEGFRIQTRYFHLAQPLVEAGERVRRGQLIARSGASGMAGGFPHLHFEVHQLVDETSSVTLRVLDPQLFWVDGAGRVTCFDKAHDWPRTPVTLTYPVPCQGQAWQ